MSLSKVRKLVLAAIAFAFVTAVPAGSSGGDCIQVIVWATNPATGVCRQFPNPCVVPQGWTISYTTPCGEAS